MVANITFIFAKVNQFIGNEIQTLIFVTFGVEKMQVGSRIQCE